MSVCRAASLPASSSTNAISRGSLGAPPVGVEQRPSGDPERSQPSVQSCILRQNARRNLRPFREQGLSMKNLLAVIGDGNAGSVLEAALMVARRFNSHIVGLHSLTTEYAVVFGGEMGFSISSEVDRTLEREGHERRDQARRLFRDFMDANGVPIGPVAPGHNGPSASWREEDGRQNAVVGMSGRVYDLILVEQPEKLASIA